MASKETPYTDAQIVERLVTMPGWSQSDKAIRRTYETDGWPITLMLVNAIGYLAELRSQVRAAVEAGLSEPETVAKLAETMKRYSGYKIFPWVHSQVNVPKTYHEMKATP